MSQGGHWWRIFFHNNNTKIDLDAYQMEAEDHFLIMIKVTFYYFPQESHEFWLYMKC